MACSSFICLLNYLDTRKRLFCYGLHTIILLGIKKEFIKDMVCEKIDSFSLLHGVYCKKTL